MNSLHSPDVLSFASDNYAGAHPQILAAVAAANGGHVAAYGYDIYTEKLQQLMRSHLGEQAQCWPVFNGTGANVLGWQAMMPPYWNASFSLKNRWKPKCWRKPGQWNKNQPDNKHHGT